MPCAAEIDDCGDNSDEENCAHDCPEHMFRCTKNGFCINASWKCDGDADCTDGTDESEDICREYRPATNSDTVSVSDIPWPLVPSWHSTPGFNQQPWRMAYGVLYLTDRSSAVQSALLC